MITRSTFLRALAAGAVVTPIAAACGGKKKAAVAPTTAAPAPTSTSSTTLPPVTTTAAPTTTVAPTTTTTIPAKVYPFTGLPATNEANYARPALAVKVNNAAAARPQAGLNQADIVIEEIVEGITRFMAVFQSTDCDKIGSVRSARNTDADLLRGLGTPLFAWSGANDGVIGVVRSLDNVTDVGYDKYGTELYTVGRRLADYTEFFISTTKAYEKTPPGKTTPAPMFTYRKAGEAPTGGKDLEKLELQMSGTHATWHWSKEKSAWLRDTDGYQHDDLDGEQLSPANVVVAFTRYEFSNGSPVAYTVGEGEAWVLTAGKIVKGTWERAKATDPYTLMDADKKPIGLTPGRTFLELPFTTEAANDPQL
jgi:hypothetical protein